MAHRPKPFFRSGRGWYVQLGKQQLKLAPGPENAESEAAAWAAFHALMADRNSANSATGNSGRKSAALESPQNSGPTVAGLYERFMEWCQKNREPGTYGWYHDHIQNFLDALPDPKMPAADLRPYHVVEWLDRHADWGDTYRRGAIVAVQRPYNWAAKLGYITDNPLKHLEKPKARRREQAVSADDVKAIFGYYDEGDPFRLLLAFCWETGVRPQEVTRAEARHVDLAGLLVVFPPKEAKGKKRVRRILLTEAAAAILKPLMEAHPDGPLFRNRDGRPWTRYAINCRFVRLKEKLGVKFANYSFRHGFAQRMLEAGNDHLTVSELLGHANGQMLSTVYSHMNKADRHLRDALKKGQG